MLSRDEAARLLAAALGWDQHGRRHHKRINRHLARFILTGIYSGTRSDRSGGCNGSRTCKAAGSIWRKAICTGRLRHEAETKKRAPSVPMGNRLLQHMRRWRRLTPGYVIECYGRPITDSLGTAFDGPLNWRVLVAARKTRTG